MKIKHIAILLLSLSAATAHAQQEMMLNSLHNLWHSNTSTNPAFFPENKHIVIGLPAYGLDAAHSGDITYKDIFRKDGDRTIVDFENAISKLDLENTLNFDQRLETFSFGFRTRNDKWGIQFGHAIAFSGTLTYPKALPELLFNGNAPYIGQTVEIGLQADIADWHEWSVGAMRKIGPLNVGARVKYLTGISALRTDDNRHSMSIYTDPDIYQLTLKTDYAFYSSSIISSIDTSDLGFDITLDALGNKLRSKNNGVAFDLGGVLKLGNRLTLDASAINLGGVIKFKNDAKYFQSKAEYTYSGTTIPGQDIINGSDSLDFDTKLDTLNDIFRFTQTASEDLETRAPMRIYVGGTFELTKHWSVGLTVFHQKKVRESSTAVGANVRWLPLRWLSLGAMYSVNDRSAANLGFHIAASPGPVQVYFLSDNLLNAFALKSSSAANLRAGLSLAF
jgi:hypothetical protein